MAWTVRAPQGRPRQESRSTLRGLNIKVQGVSGVPRTPSLRNLNLGCDRRLPPCAWSLPLPLGLPACFRSSDLLPPGTSSLCCSSVPPPPGSLPKLPRQNSLPAVHALCMQQAHTTFYPARNAVLDAVSFPSWSQCRAGASGAQMAFSFLGPMDPVWGAFDNESWRRGLR